MNVNTEPTEPITTFYRFYSRDFQRRAQLTYTNSSRPFSQNHNSTKQSVSDPQTPAHPSQGKGRANSSHPNPAFPDRSVVRSFAQARNRPVASQTRHQFGLNHIRIRRPLLEQPHVIQDSDGRKRRSAAADCSGKHLAEVRTALVVQHPSV